MNETVFQALMRLEYANYLRLKECIQTGSVSELEKALDEITLFPNEPEGLAASVYMRSIKTRGIRICTLAGYIAIESNAPYHKVLNISEKTVIQLEHAESLARVSDLVRKTITDITRVVEVERMQSYSKPVRQVLAYIREHYAEKITLSLLAERTELSTFYLSTLIKKETGLSLTDHINMTRIEESKRMLLDENASIIEVADRVGFLYQNHFSTVFKKITGMTPTEFIQSRDRSEY
ncbi:MAG: HTH-type transcriptional activator Btr [Firmicutes bacterium ADurb.Bin262]|nr:MAG: HTH-type transcriptional activator Btr [Firmicutes bacterium ADurb.Bin262]